MNEPLPPLGAFLRPIGMRRYNYCMRVVNCFDDEDQPGIGYERWAIVDGRPSDDGEIRKGYFIDLVPTLIPGVWRYPPQQPDRETLRDGYRYATPSYHNWETYYRLMPENEAGQLELFK